MKPRHATHRLVQPRLVGGKARTPVDDARTPAPCPVSLPGKKHLAAGRTDNEQRYSSQGARAGDEPRPGYLRHQVAKRFQAHRPDAGYGVEVVDRRERAVLLAVVEDLLALMARPGHRRSFLPRLSTRARQQPPPSGHADGKRRRAPSGTARLASHQGVGGAPLIRNGTVTMLDATPRSSRSWASMRPSSFRSGTTFGASLKTPW